MVGNITFGAWLKRRRRQLDLTQKGLAYQAGCSVGTIRKMEADERRPSRQLATLLAQHLDIPSDQLEPFIAFARTEPYTADTSFPILAPAEGETPAIPAVPQETPARPIKHNLPPALTPFLGREAELAALDDLFRNLDRRLVTIVGPGGIGKTRLALAYARQLVSQPVSLPTCANGVFLVDLAPLPESERLVFTFAEAIGFRIQGEAGKRRSPEQQFLDFLRDRRMLLLLDNFEHLLAEQSLASSSTPGVGEAAGAAGLVAEILQTAPGVRILVTSRERLNLHSEQLFPIEGLAFPDWETATPEDEVRDAADYSAVQLFLQAAHRCQPGFTLENREELTALVRICRLVDGMPLALELAASWIDTLSLMDIATELKRGLDILEAELRDVPQRQRSVKATFDYSWQKLDEKEQSGFAQLSIFRGGFTQPAAQAVTGATPRQLSRLVNKSFLKFNKGRDRYQVHELLRQYGAERLGRDSKMEQAVQDRHSTYYCQVLANHTGAFQSAREAQALYAIEADIENMRLAWNHAVTRKDWGSVGACLESLYRFYFNTKIFAGVDEFEKAVARLRTGEVIGERGVILGRLLAYLGNYYHWTGPAAKAVETVWESLNLLRRLEAREETLMPLLFLAGEQRSLGESNRLLRESLDLAREVGDQWAIGDALLQMGSNTRAAGDYEQAEQLGQEVLQQFRHIGDVGGIAMALQDLADIAVDRGRYEEALALAQETIPFTQEFNFLTLGLWSLGKTKYALGAYEQAEDLFEKGLTFVREIGFDSAIRDGLFFLGKTAFHMGKYACALQRHEESLAGALENDDLVLITQNHDALGRLNIVQNAGTQAKEHFQTSLQVAIPLAQPPILLASIVSVAELFAEEGDLEYAALLTMLITNHPASQAKIKERAACLLTQLEGQLSADDLANIRRCDSQYDLDNMAEQLLLDLQTS